MIESIISLSYLVAVVLFIVGMRMLSHPDTARRGNGIALSGMVLAIIASMLTPGLSNILLILIAMAVGTVGGLYFSKTVKMTAMPELVSFFNGMGGAAAALIGLVEYQTLSMSDRKSTRLNSSHVRISYAVFCLKKKKQTRETCESVFRRFGIDHV